MFSTFSQKGGAVEEHLPSNLPAVTSCSSPFILMRFKNIIIKLYKYNFKNSSYWPPGEHRADWTSYNSPGSSSWAFGKGSDLQLGTVSQGEPTKACGQLLPCFVLCRFVWCFLTFSHYYKNFLLPKLDHLCGSSQTLLNFTSSASLCNPWR